MKKALMIMTGSLCVAFCGCVGTRTYTTDPRQVTFSRADVLEMPDMQFPANYNVRDFKNVKMGVAVGKLEGRQIDRDGNLADLTVDPKLSARLQGQFASLKRFTVYSVFNRDGVAFFKELEDVDEVSMKGASSTVSPDYILNLNIRILKERHEVHMSDDKVLVVAECDANCVDLSSDTVYFSEKSRGRHWYAKARGYDSQEGKKLADAIDLAAKKAIVEMMNRVGNYFPVGGKILDVTPSGKQMALNRGSNHGVAEAQQCVVFVRDEGVDIPIALAEAESGKDECTLSVYKWNEGDPDAAYFIDVFRKSPMGFCEKNDVYAVGYGIPPAVKLEY